MTYQNELRAINTALVSLMTRHDEATAQADRHEATTLAEAIEHLGAARAVLGGESEAEHVSTRGRWGSDGWESGPDTP